MFNYFYYKFLMGACSCINSESKRPDADMDIQRVKEISIFFIIIIFKQMH